MIKIIVDNIALNLYPDTSIRLSYKFPWPTEENIPAASSYWFNIPSKGNEPFFKNLKFINSTYKLYQVQAILQVGENQYKANMIIKNAKYKEYKAFLVFNEYVAELAAQKLSVLNYEQYLGETTNEISIAVQNLNTNFSTNFAFPMLKNAAFFSSNEAYLGYINYWNPIDNLLQANYRDVNGIHDVNVMVAMPKIAFIIEKIFEKINYSVDNLFNRADFSRLFLYSNFAIRNNSDIEYLFAENNTDTVLPFYTSLRFPTVISDIDNTLSADFKTYHATSAGNYRFVLRGTVTTPANVDLYFYVKINGIQQAYSIQALTASSKEVTITSDIGTAETDFDVTFWAFFAVSGVGVTFANLLNYSIEVITSLDGNYDRFGKKFNLGEILPDKTISEFINALAKKFGIAVFFNFEEQSAQLQQFNDIINNESFVDISEIVISQEEELFFDDEKLQFETNHSANQLSENNFKSLTGFTRLPDIDYVKDLPSVSSLNKLIYVRNENTYYISAFDTVYFWKLYSDNFYPTVPEGKEITKIPVEISSVFMRTETGITLPAVEQQGTTNTQGASDSGLILMNFWNMRNNAGLLLPYASCNQYTYDEYNAAYGTDLSDQAVYANYQKQIADYIAEHKPVEFNLVLSHEFFNDLVSLFKAGKKTRKIRIGSRKFIPESLDITIKMNGFGDTKIRVR